MKGLHGISRLLTSLSGISDEAKSTNKKCKMATLGDSQSLFADKPWTVWEELTESNSVNG
jgi:hypothetical protein